MTDNRIAVCTPWSSPFMFTDYVDATLNMRHPRGYEVNFIRGAGWCPARRHINCCEKALQWGADLIVIIGADQVHPPDMLERLVGRRDEGYEIVSALVPCRGYVHWQPMMPFQPMAWRFKTNEELGDGSYRCRRYRGMDIDSDMIHVINPKDGDMQRVDFIGSGVLMFHRDHLEAVERPWFKETVDFATQQRTANMDCIFVWRLQNEADARVWVDTTIKVRHAHVFQIDDTFSDRFADWAAGGGDANICINRQYKVCERCVMDTSDEDIMFNSEGVCNHCLRMDRLFSDKTGHYSSDRLDAALEKIKRDSGDNPHDCVIGVSGGADSSYVLYRAVGIGLRPLAVHVDNGWDTPRATANIRVLVDKMGLELVDIPLDREMFLSLQRAFIKASVIDIEMVTDYLVASKVAGVAEERGIRHILSGENLNTEHGMPEKWSWDKSDRKNIEAIHDAFGEASIELPPSAAEIIRRSNIETFPLLNYLDYKRTEAINILERECQWRDYGDKHWESLFTKFYQAHILPKKFRIDKRRVHLSALVRNGEMPRYKALEKLERPTYDPDELSRDKPEVLRKLGFTEPDFDRLMSRAPIPHSQYDTDNRRGQTGRGAVPQKIIYITGCARSGTTLVYRLFSAFKNISLARGALGVQELEKVAVPPEQRNNILVVHRKARTVFSDSLPEDKVNRQLRVLEQLGVRVVNVVRDGRDAVMSDYTTPDRWMSSIGHCLRYPDVPAITLRYEDIVGRPDAVQEDAARVLGLETRHRWSDYPEFVPAPAIEWSVEEGGEPYGARPLSADRVGIGRPNPEMEPLLERLGYDV